MVSKNFVIVVLLIVVAIFAFFFYQERTTPIVDLRQGEVDSLNAQLEYYSELSTLLGSKVDSIEHANEALFYEKDSLEEVKSKVKYRYVPKYIYISTANNIQLDSVIRSNW